MNAHRVLRAFFVVLFIGIFATTGILAAGKPVKPAPVSHTALQTPPIQLGTSGGSVVDIANGYCCSGTLGALVQKSGKQYILSNTHVFAGDSQRGGNGIVSKIGDDISQPGNVDTSCGTGDYNVVADLSDWVPVTDGVVDAAIAQVRDGMVDPSGAILEIGVLNPATLDATLGLSVKKSGRTSGLTKSTVAMVDTTVQIGYSTECAGTSYIVTYTGQIIIQNKGEKFLRSGDSGSLMVENVSSYPRAVGLLYAGSRSIAIANPIGDVLSALGVTMVGTTGVASAEVSPDGETVPPGQLMKAMRLQRLNSGILEKVPGAIGHGIGVSGGKPVIKILVEEITPEALAAAPQSIDDIPVVVEAVGKIVAY